jgi:uncharacterized protein YqhQ
MKWEITDPQTYLKLISLVMQKITTREPTDDQIEVAIAAMKKVI